MTVKNALEYWKFKYNQAKDCADYYREISEYIKLREYTRELKTAINALEIQTPAEEIKFHKYDYGRNYYCPICHNPIIHTDKYCSECGRALVWK